VAAIYEYWLIYIHGLPWVQRISMIADTQAFATQAGFASVVASRSIVSFAYLGLWISPFLAGQAVILARRASAGLDRRVARAALVSLAVAGLILYAASKYAGHFPYFFNIINWNGVGNVPLMGTKASVFPSWLNRFAEAVAIPSGGILAWRIVEVLRATRFGRHAPALATVVLGLGLIPSGYFMLVRFYDRYLLALVPLAVVLVLHGRPLSLRGQFVAALVCAAMLTYSVIGLADYLDWNEARWAAGRSLVAQGVPTSEIDGGLEWLGWYLYEQAPEPPPSLPANFSKDYWMGWGERRYWLSFTTVEGYTVQSSAPYGNYGGRIYILTRSR
jgi:hypothetical protein